MIRKVWFFLFLVLFFSSVFSINVTTGSSSDTRCDSSGVVCVLDNDIGYDFVDLDFTGTSGFSDGVDDVGDNNKVKVSATDTTAGYLSEKAVGGTCIESVVNNSGAYESVVFNLQYSPYTFYDIHGYLELKYDTNDFLIDYTNGLTLKNHVEDTNATTECSGTTFLSGEGTCIDYSGFGSGSSNDTNVWTEGYMNGDDWIKDFTLNKSGLAKLRVDSNSGAGAYVILHDGTDLNSFLLKARNNAFYLSVADDDSTHQRTLLGMNKDAVYLPDNQPLELGTLHTTGHKQEIYSDDYDLILKNQYNVRGIKNMIGTQTALYINPSWEGIGFYTNNPEAHIDLNYAGTVKQHITSYTGNNGILTFIDSGSTPYEMSIGTHTSQNALTISQGTNFGTNDRVRIIKDGDIFFKPVESDNHVIFENLENSSVAWVDVNGNYWGSNFIPKDSNTYDLGSELYPFRNLYLQGNIITTSDKLLKTDYGDINHELVSLLNPVSFRYIGSNKTQYGFFAQDIDESFSNAGVDTNNLGLIQKSGLVTYDKLVCEPFDYNEEIRIETDCNGDYDLEENGVCYNLTYQTITDENCSVVTTTEENRMGIDYQSLSALIVADLQDLRRNPVSSFEDLNINNNLYLTTDGNVYLGNKEGNQYLCFFKDDDYCKNYFGWSKDLREFYFSNDVLLPQVLSESNIYLNYKSSPTPEPERDTNQWVYFWDNGVARGQKFGWNKDLNHFWLSTDIDVNGSINADNIQDTNIWTEGYTNNSLIDWTNAKSNFYTIGTGEFEGKLTTSEITANKTVTLNDKLVSNNGCGIPNATFVAEENSTLEPSSYEWSMGNGDDPNYGTYQACNGTITAMSVICDYCSNGKSTVGIKVDSSDVKCKTDIDTLEADISSNSYGGYTTDCDDSFLAGQTLRFYTIDDDGSCGGCVATMWVRYD